MNELELARRLIRAGMPVFVAKRVLASDGSWDATGGVGGYRLPTLWQRTKADEAVLERWVGGDALCAIGGVTFGTVDIDPRNGGEESWAAWTAEHGEPKIYLESKTPSGGRHLLIATLDVAALDGMLQGVDFKDGRADGTSRGFVFLAPTRKVSKETGSIESYSVVNDSGLRAVEDLAVELGLDVRDLVAQDRSGEELRGWVAAKRSAVRRDLGPRPDADPGRPYNPFDSTQQTTREAEAQVRRWVEAVRMAGKGNIYPTLNDAALQLGHYVGSLLEEGGDPSGLPPVTGQYGVVSASAERLLRGSLDANGEVQAWRAGGGRAGRAGWWDETRTIRKGLFDGARSRVAVIDPPSRNVTLVVDRQMHVSLDANGEQQVEVIEVVSEVEEVWDWTEGIGSEVRESDKAGDGLPLYENMTDELNGDGAKIRPTRGRAR